MTSKPLKPFDPLSLGERSTRHLRSTAIPQIGVRSRIGRIGTAGADASVS
jgi:hypothetical protein